MKLIQKLHQIQTKCSVIDKSGYNKFSRYEYIQLGDILEKVNPLLKELGLVIVQSVVESSCEYKPIDAKNYYSVANCVVETTLYDTENEERISNKSSGFAMDKNGDKAAFKSITGARKYGLSTMFKAHWDAVEPEQDTPRHSGSSKRTTKKPPRHSGASQPDTDYLDFDF